MPQAAMMQMIMQVVQQLVQKLVQMIQQAMQENQSNQQMQQQAQQEMQNQQITNPQEQQSVMFQVAEAFLNLGDMMAFQRSDAIARDWPC
jgi:Mg2+/Co2+ transporter CorB